MIFAAETLAALGVRLAGDLIVATNTDEESSGAGGVALVAPRPRADAGIVPEPTGFDVWVACRGSAYATVTVPGRPGHAEVAQPHWRDGGAVNAIEKATIVARRDPPAARGVARPLRPAPSAPVRPGRRRRRRSRRRVGGDVSRLVPMTVASLYVPRQADADGWGTDVEREVAEWIRLRRPPTPGWPSTRRRSSGTTPRDADGDPARRSRSSADRHGGGRESGRPRSSAGLDSWYDGATFTLLAGTPSVGFGPAGFDPGGRSVAHTVDEYVPVDDLVACAQALAVVALRFCGGSRVIVPELPPEIADLKARVRRFVEEEVFPVEARIAERG